MDKVITEFKQWMKFQKQRNDQSKNYADTVIDRMITKLKYGMKQLDENHLLKKYYDSYDGIEFKNLNCFEIQEWHVFAIIDNYTMSAAEELDKMEGSNYFEDAIYWYNEFLREKANSNDILKRIIVSYKTNFNKTNEEVI